MKRNFLKYLAALLLFGSNGIVASQISLTSYEIVFWRTMIGSVLLITLFFITRQRVTFTHHKMDLLFITASGIAMGTSWIFLYEAYATVGISLASLEYYCGPVIVMAFSPIVFKEKLTAEKLIGFAVVLVGIFLVNGNAAGTLSGWGLFCGGMSAVMYSLMVMLNKKSENVKGLENSMIQLTMSFLTVAVFTGIQTGFRLQVESSEWLWIAVLGLLNTGIGCWFYFSSITFLPVQTVAICGYIEPLSAVVLAVIVLGEQMLPIQILGAVLIIGGAIFGECVRIKRKK